jgi:hypothetical protein
MEADWEVEIGADAPAIEAPWTGFVDLRIAPDEARELPECIGLPGLAEVLIRLNAGESPVWTVKCDVWQVAEFDLDELDAPREAAQHALGCYIDLLPRESTECVNLDKAIQWCRKICARLQTFPLRSSRADLVLRRALQSNERSELGVTAYLTACGKSPREAASKLVSALNALAVAVVTVSWIEPG